MILRQTYSDVDDAPDAALAILRKDGADLVRLGEVRSVCVDLGAVLVLLGRIWRQRISR